MTGDAHTFDAKGSAPFLRPTGLIGLGAMAILVSLSEIIARTPAGAERTGPALAPPSPAFPFGTDLLGRDVAGETLRALAVTADRAVMAASIAILAGSLLGFVAARAPIAVAFTLQRIASALASLPAIFIAVLLAALGSQAYTPLYAGLAAAPTAFAHAFVRARALGRTPHAEFARTTGVTATRLLSRDLAYEFRSRFLSVAGEALAAVTIILSTASFFGFGARPPVRDLGLMIAAARETYFSAWWTAAFPALALTLMVLFARLAAGPDEGERP